MNELRNLAEPLLTEPEPVHQNLEGALISRVGELAFEHVEPHRSRGAPAGRRKGEFGVRIDEVLDQPSRAHAVDAGPRPGHPDVATILARRLSAGAS